ncbi:hypothetical protein EN935_40605 [Mesorhizobium sp. M7D.F.Ca.US.004.03.1.1]|uniref:hypothetical protein n=1 Tax=Mesorhizobium sp. M7D.F.Ca.US.004.03.1.1 TaxID=2496702 RepID=UPI000FCAC331|nr:hypothetical protein [Mesorhizobium sp. M7D.F.Ca.US.004.03.1.1]RVA08607.1 hypothetical protein EN935_40605 [Mesorhizobium sp. M7D.F.Ca.US.004.03.1.1]
MHTRYQIPAHSSPKSGKLEAVLCLFDDPAKVVNHPRLSRRERVDLQTSNEALISALPQSPGAVEDEALINKQTMPTLWQEPSLGLR